MDEKEKLLEQIKGLIADSQKENVSKKDLDARVDGINKAIADKLTNEDIKTLKESVDKLVIEVAANAAAIKAHGEIGKKVAEAPRTTKEAWKQALVNAVMEASKDVPGLLSEKNDDFGKRLSLKDYFGKKGNHSTPAFVVKTEMLESSIVQSNVATIRLAELDPQRVGVPLTIYPHVLDWMPSRTISRPTMSILVVYSYSDGAATKTEGSASTISSFLLKTVEFKSFFIATYFTFSDETLDDLEEAMEELSITAPSKILDKVDGYILGTAGDDSTAIAGLLTANKKTDFASATTYASSIADANKVDAIATMKLQAEASNYHPDVVLLAAAEINEIAAEKDSMDNSKLDRRVVFNNLGEPSMICGMRIIKTTSTAMAANIAVVLDSQQLIIGKRKEMTMEIGYNAADLTEGQKTVVIKVRLAFGVRDPLAVIYCSDIDAAVSAITV